MGAQSLATFDAAMKDLYTPGLRNAINNRSTYILAMAERDLGARGATFERIRGGGRKLVWSARVRRSTGTGARAELEAMPPAGNIGFAQPSQTLRYVYHKIKLSGQSLDLAEGGDESFASALQEEMDGAENDLRNDVGRQLFGQLYTSRTGVLAVCGTTTASLVVQLAATTLVSEMRAFFVGEYVDLLDNAGVLLAQGKARKITAIDRTNKTITIDTTAVTDVTGAGSGVVTTAATNVVSRHGSNNDELLGLRALITTSGSVHGVDAATEPAWASVGVGSSTTSISEDILEEAYDAIQTDGDGNGDEGFTYCSSHSQQRVLASRLQSTKRWDGQMATLTAGWKGVNLMHGTFVADKYAPEDRVLQLRAPEIGWAVGRDFGFDTVGGQQLYQALDDTDAVEAKFKGYVAMLALNRNSHALITLQAV